MYQRSDAFSLSPMERTEEHNKNYSNPDNDPKGPWRSGDVRNALFRPNLKYDITTPSGKTIPPPANGWRWSKETLASKIATGEISFSPDETRIIRKIYLSTLDGRAAESIWFGKDVGTTRDANSQLKKLFDGEVPFDTPKPIELIKQMMTISGVKEGDTVLDFFAGSGTTGHAVIDAYPEGGVRFILVQLPEPVDSEIWPTVAAITRDRISRACVESKANVGYRSFHLSSSNFRAWDSRNGSSEDIQLQLTNLADNTVEGRTEEDILTELLLKAGFDLTSPAETLTLADKTVFSISNGALLMSLDEDITVQVIEEMVSREPQMIICLDEAFRGDDQLKVNAVQTVESRNRTADTDIAFRVV